MRTDFEEPRSSDICLATLETNYDEKIKTWNGNNYPLITYKSYTQKHDYDFYYIKDEELVNDYDPVFNYKMVKRGRHDLNREEYGTPITIYKTSLLLKLLKEKNYEYVFFIDSFDCILTNLEKKLEEFVDSKNSVFLSGHPPQYELKNEEELIQNNSSDSRIINAGFMALRNSVEVFEFFKEGKRITKNGYKFRDDQSIMRKALFSLDFSFIKSNVAINDPFKQKYWMWADPDFQRTPVYSNHHKRKDLWQRGDFMVHVLGSTGVSYKEIIPRFYSYTNQKNDLLIN